MLGLVIVSLSPAGPFVFIHYHDTIEPSTSTEVAVSVAESDVGYGRSIDVGLTPAVGGWFGGRSARRWLMLEIGFVTEPVRLDHTNLGEGVVPMLLKTWSDIAKDNREPLVVVTSNRSFIVGGVG